MDLIYQINQLNKVNYSDEQFDVILVPLVLMYISRINILKAVSELDRVLKNNGLLIITDFYPDVPKKVCFKHNTKLFTYKQKFK